MEEKEEVKRKILKHLVYNIIVFSTIFIVFGILLSIIMKSTIYNKIDKELKDSIDKICEATDPDFDIVYKNNIIDYIRMEDLIKNIINNTQESMIASKVDNPNVMVIIRDVETEKILNKESVGRLTSYIDEISFNSKVLNKIYECSIEGKYYYRCINFIYENNLSERKYVQLLINIDNEKVLLNNYSKIAFVAVLNGIGLSIIASYVLSKKTLKTLEENMEKQVEFVQNVSHELRTPLTIIQAKQELLLQEPNAKIIDKSEDIILTLNETKRLTKLIKDLMILSRADESSINLKKENVNIDDYIKEIVLPYIELAEVQNKKIILNLGYNLDMEIDTSRFYQLMVILIDNGLKYTEENDTIEIKTYQKDNKFVLEVKDTGIGVSDEGLKRIFERFYREDKARRKRNRWNRTWFIYC